MYVSLKYIYINMINTFSSLSGITTATKMAPPIPIPPYTGLTFSTYTTISTNITNSVNMYYGPSYGAATKIITCNTDGEKIFYFGKNRTNSTQIYTFTSDNSGNSFTTTTFTPATPDTTTFNSITACCMSRDGVYRYFNYTGSQTNSYSIYKSTDSGQNYSSLTVPGLASTSTGRNVRNIVCSQNGKYVLALVYTNSATNPCIFYSSNYGEGLTNIALPYFFNNPVNQGTIVQGWVSYDGLRVLIGAARKGLFFASGVRDADDNVNTNLSYSLVLSANSTNASITSISVSDNEQTVFCTIQGTDLSGAFLSRNGLTGNYTKLTNFTYPTTFLDSRMDSTGRVLLFSCVFGTTAAIYYSTDYGASWTSQTFVGSATVSGLGLAPNQSVAYVSVSNPASFSNASSSILYKIT
jgi:hypothetical protein